ncbi:hypothetical protein E3U43_006966, partial [Larimichthys crocea]
MHSTQILEAKIITTNPVSDHRQCSYHPIIFWRMVFPLETYRKASQLNIFGAPMRNVRKMALRQSDSSSPESGFRRSNPSPNMRQKRGPLSASIKSKRHEIKSDPTPFGYE